MLQKKRWENVREFINLLIEKFDADVNAKIEKQILEADKMPKEDSLEWYCIPQLANSCVAIVALHGHDPDIGYSDVITTKNKGIIFCNIVKKGANLNIKNVCGQTPLSTAIKKCYDDLIAFMIQEGGCDPSMPASDWHNKDNEYLPLHLACKHSSIPVSTYLTLIEHGSDVNGKLDKSQMTFLHVLMSEGCQEKSGILQIAEKLSMTNFDFNCQDSKGRNVMHYCVRKNNEQMDANYELEVRLTQMGVSLGHQDIKKRTPLFYVLKRQTTHWRYRNQNEDNAELVKLLCKSMTKKEINLQDKDGKTVLHYVAQKGAAVCCMYLLMVGADVLIKDNDGNTPINVAVINNHDGCATALFQGGSSLKDPVVKLSDKEKERRKKAKKDATSDEKETEDSKDSTDVWKWDALHEMKEEKAISFLPIYRAAIEENLKGTSMFIADADEAKSGMNDYHAITMSMSSCRYNTSYQLICTTTNVQTLRQKGEENRNLLHILALSCERSQSASDATVCKIAKHLIDRKVPVSAPDKWNVTPLQYAILNRNFDLADLLAEQSGGYNVNYKDGFNRSHIAATCWNIYSQGMTSETWKFIEKLLGLKANPDELFDLPMKPELGKFTFSGDMKNPNYWQKYPDAQTTCLIIGILCTQFSNNFCKPLLKHGADPNIADSNKVTPLMHAVTKNDVHLVKLLLNYDYDPNAEDETDKKEKKSPKKTRQSVFRLKTVESDDSEEESSSSSEEESSDKEEEKSEGEPEFKPIKKTSPVNLNAKDSKKWTALHYALSPHEYGTYDNPEIVYVLATVGALMSSDALGCTPLDLAIKKNAPKTEKVLRTAFKIKVGSHKRISTANKPVEVDDKIQWSDPGTPDFKAAAEKLLKRHDSGMEVDNVFVHEIDKNCNVKDKGDLMKDEELNEFYDVLLTKVDINKTEWGMYNFYQIQLIHLSKKSLYILFTRWGRIGDDGQYQHTPFSDKELAEKEFKKIFREKTGNKWTDMKNFEKKPKKYRLVEDMARIAPPALKDVDIDLETSVKSVLPKHLFSIIKLMMNPKEMQLSVNRFCEMDSKYLPFGQLNKDRLLQGKHILEEIRKLQKEKDEFKSARRNKKSDPQQDLEYQKVMEKISELSNDYYHVIPQKNYSCEKMRPLVDQYPLSAQIVTINNLLDYEIACKMLFGAMANKKSMNCVDYIYKCLDCKIELMDEHDVMSQLILQYIYSGSRDTKIQAIYKVCRANENKRLLSTGLENHALLWHGTSNCNLLSILSKGLLGAPIDSQSHAWRFGKGIYLSDDFEKSNNYIHNGDCKTSFMLLCEAALGKVRKVDRHLANKEDIDIEKTQDWDSLFVPAYQAYPQKDWYNLPHGVSLPRGDKVCNNTGSYGCHTEYVLKSPDQVALRYLIQFKDGE